MDPLLERFFAERKSSAQIRKLCEPKVVRWEYWNRPKWHLDPQDMLSYGTLVRIAQPVPEDAAEYAYGYDKEGRVVVVRQGLASKVGEGCIRRDFLRYSDNRIIGSRFLGDTATDAFEATLSAGRVVRIEHSASTGMPPWQWKTFEWEGNRLLKVAQGLTGNPARRELTYDAQGRVVADVDLSKPPKRIPLPAGVTVQSLVNEIRQRLVPAVVAAVSKAGIKGPVYCLTLCYDCEGNALLPPQLGLGLDAGPQAWLKGSARKDRSAIWNPDEPSIFTQKRPELKDSNLSRACDLLNRELGYRGSSEPARKLILQAAADLAKVDWKRKLNTTDDFIVYAVDTDLADLRRNLKLTVAPKQLAKLKAAKLL